MSHFVSLAMERKKYDATNYDRNIFHYISKLKLDFILSPVVKSIREGSQVDRVLKWKLWEDNFPAP